MPAVLVALAVALGGSLPARAASPQEVDAALQAGRRLPLVAAAAGRQLGARSRPQGRGPRRQRPPGGYVGRLHGAGDLRPPHAGEKRQDPRHGAGGKLPQERRHHRHLRVGRAVPGLVAPPPDSGEPAGSCRRTSPGCISGQGQRGNATAMWDYLSGPNPKWLESARRRVPASTTAQPVRRARDVGGGGQRGLDHARPVEGAFDHAWRSHQNNNGGWAYASIGGDDENGTLSMTAAGVATLFITRDMLSGTTGGFCHGNQSDPSIDRGIQWIVEHWRVPNDGYTLFGIERIGAAAA